MRVCINRLDINSKNETLMFGKRSRSLHYENAEVLKEFDVLYLGCGEDHRGWVVKMQDGSKHLVYKTGRDMPFVVNKEFFSSLIISYNNIAETTQQAIDMID